MKKSWLWLASMLLVLSLFLAACGDDKDADKKKDDEDKQEEKQDDDKKEEEEDTSGPQAGGTLVYAIDSAPSGPLDVNFYGSSTEAEVWQFVQENLIDFDETFTPIPRIIDWETDDFKTYHFTMKEGIKWHNGDELTVHDWVLALETLADKDYKGSRWSNVKDIVGAQAYRDGEADSISGITVNGDYEVTIEFETAKVNHMLNLWTYPMNSTVFGDMPVAEMEDNEQIREMIIGTGPFTMENARTGEFYEMKKFADYWDGEPYLDGVNVRVVPNTSVIGALQNGEVDMIPVHPTQGEEADAMDHVSVITYPGVSYYYIGFRLGRYDHEQNKVVDQYDKFQNKQLRQALWYAIDRESWVDAFFGGYGKVIDAPVPPVHWIAADPSELPNNYEYDPEKAKELLDSAGYVDVDGDGLREDPDGEKFTVKFSHYATGNPDFETRAQLIVQYWQDVGIDAQLDMIDVGLYYEGLETNDPDQEEPPFDTFFGGWSVGADPDPTGLWSNEGTYWNFPRFDNEKSEELMANALDVDFLGTDLDEQIEKRKELYVEWQQLINEEVPMIIIANLDEVYAVNDRVGGLEYDVTGFNNSSEWYIKQD
ncbi:oligopeptide ABC transporter substrate-binding protein [Bacillaceae bacterium W0354]